MSENLIQKTVDRIKEERIKPDPKWKFVCGDFLIWLGFLLTVVLIAISLSIIFYLISRLDWDIYRNLPIRKSTVFLRVLPFVWIFLLLVFLFLSLLNFKKTKKGYRYSKREIVGLIFGTGVLFSLIISFLGIEKKINDQFLCKIPRYQKFAYTSEMQWSQPEDGFLGGRVIEVKGDMVDLKGFDGEVWYVAYDSRTNFVPREFFLEQDKLVKIIGEIIDREEHQFKAHEVRCADCLKNNIRVIFRQQIETY